MVNSFEIYSFTQLNEVHKRAIYTLWNNEYPEKIAFNNQQEIDEYLQNLIDPKHLFTINENGEIKGWAVIFERDYEKWFAIIIDGNYHNKGLGKKLLDRLKIYSDELNGWVIDHENDVKTNGEIYSSPLDFYLKNNFDKISETRLELDKISAVKIKWKA